MSRVWRLSAIVYAVRTFPFERAILICSRQLHGRKVAQCGFPWNVFSDIPEMRFSDHGGFFREEVRPASLAWWFWRGLALGQRRRNSKFHAVNMPESRRRKRQSLEEDSRLIPSFPASVAVSASPPCLALFPLTCLPPDPFIFFHVFQSIACLPLALSHFVSFHPPSICCYVSPLCSFTSFLLSPDIHCMVCPPPAALSSSFHLMLLPQHRLL